MGDLETNILMSFLLYQKGLMHTACNADVLKCFAKPEVWCSDSHFKFTNAHKELFENEIMAVHLSTPSLPQGQYSFAHHASALLIHLAT